MCDFAGIKTELLQLIYLKLLQILHTDSFTTSICFTKDSDVISSLFLWLLLGSQDQLNSLVLISPQVTLTCNSESVSLKQQFYYWSTMQKTVETKPYECSHLNVQFQQTSRGKSDKCSLSLEVLFEKGLFTIKGANF